VGGRNKNRVPGAVSRLLAIHHLTSPAVGIRQRQTGEKTEQWGGSQFLTIVFWAWIRWTSYRGVGGESERDRSAFFFGRWHGFHRVATGARERVFCLGLIKVRGQMGAKGTHVMEKIGKRPTTRV